jgi:mono/diheme cytochrome c family protein
MPTEERSHMQFSKNGTLFVIAAIVANTSLVHAVQIGSAEQGLAIAREKCAECHLVVKERGRSTYDNAPTFVAIANTRGMSATALRAALNTSHREMPNLVIKASEADSIIAYILSLRDVQ